MRPRISAAPCREYNRTGSSESTSSSAVNANLIATRHSVGASSRAALSSGERSFTVLCLMSHL